jgi:hypothetical protein
MARKMLDCSQANHLRGETAMKLSKIATALALAIAAASAAAAPITFSGSSGSLAASASFDIVGSQLQVVLTNTSTSDVLVPADLLTAVFFSAPTLTPVSATLTAGSTVFFGPDGGGNVGGEWAYGTGFSGPGGATSGISSSGFGLFGGFNFGGADLDPPTAVNGMNYGILSAGDNTATGNAQVTGGEPLIKNSVTFLLSGLPGDFLLASIANVSFQYGTALTEPNFPGSSGGTGGSGGGGGSGGIPEPGTLSLAGAAILGGFFYSRRRKQAQG